MDHNKEEKNMQAENQTGQFDQTGQDKNKIAAVSPESESIRSRLKTPFASQLEQSKALRQMADLVSRNPFAGYIGIEILDIVPGHARARIRIEAKHKNIYGAMHGGCAFSLADTMAGMAVAAYGDYVTTLEASMNYMRPVADTEYLYCDADVLRNGNKISVVRTELTNDNGKLLIDGSFTFYHFSE